MSIIMQCSDTAEKVCIQANRVFDACLKQQTLTDQDITVSNVTPASTSTPLTYVSARSSSVNGTIQNLVITPQQDSNLARFQGTVVIPLTVNYTDSAGTPGTGTSTLSVPFDIVLCVPNQSIIPYQLTSVVSAGSQIGTYTGSSSDSGSTVYNFTIDICINIIMKVIMQVELIVSSYGYAVIPPCTDYGDGVCEAFFSLPLYPDATQ